MGYTMKKQTLLFIAMLVFALNGKAQTLFGIPFKGNTNDFAMALVNQKKFIKPATQPKGMNAVFLKGQVLGNDCDIYIIGTPKTNQVCKLVAYTIPSTTFSNLTNTYDRIHQLLEVKYGKDSQECVDYFKSPYERHDGYEMNAIKLGKYVRMCGFGSSEPNLSVFAIIENTPKVQIIWENKENMTIMIKERNDSAKDEL